ncbi:hypothetical protein LOK49_LG13G00103 [Camellia lanceoleosa]|uniref:Uncharacterized protein n=1 Tax=Camellia lanceoleosa TaxID=1840588 RepID=A0ACC0FG42_9ERIC|nr:hypothetical protein LOK49_LG13G00103 [Camellia lanceoleosa]
MKKTLCKHFLHEHTLELNDKAEEKCRALPPTLKYNNHIHRLTFTNSPIKDHHDEDDEAELYCDACEKRRDLAQATYYCEKCHYVAHPHCVVSEIIHILEEKWSKHENVENSELRRSAHLDKVSARVMKKPVFEVDVAMPWENWDSTSKVKDGNYMILENQVSILKVLFSKYGDFSNRSRLSTKAIMLFIMTVCEAVYNMCNTKVADITTSLLLTWFHSFALAQYANFEIMFVIARLTKLVRAHFGLQADHDVPVDLNLAGLSVQIAKQLAVIDSKALAIVKQDGETDDLRKKVDSMQQTISKLDEAIQELENNKQAIGKKKQALGKKKQKHALEKEKEALEKNKKALLKTREEKCVRKECLIDALELEGQMAGTKAYKRSVQGEKGKILLCLYEDGDKDEYNKIDMIKVLMKKFVSKVEVTLPWENWDSTSKVIEDGNYMILENRVSILEALLSKYRDLSKSSRLGTKATMLFAMTVCEAVHDMCSTKIGDITTSQLLIWLLSFTLAQYASFEIQFVIARLTKLVHAHFGLQADDDIPTDLELAKMGVPIATQLSVVDSKELSNIEQDGETNDDLWKKVSLQLTIMKLDEAIENLKKKKQALLKMQEDRCLRKECLIDVLELERQMAGASLL